VGPALIEQIRALADEVGECFIFTVSEPSVRFLAEHRDQLGKAKPLVPDVRSISVARDKQQTLDAARRHGIEVPATMEPRSPADLRQIERTLRFPVVLKWSDAGAVLPNLDRAGIPFVKLEYAHDATELHAALRRYEPLGKWPLVQEYCRGRGLGQFFYMHDGEARRRFQHVRIAEWPPEGGFSSVCDAVPLDRHAELQEASVALLRDIGWEGVAMVEYRYDPAADRAVLMEINGRYWGSFPLAVHCGAGFALYAYFVQGLKEDFELPPPRDDLRCRMVATELKRIVRIGLQPGKIQDRTFQRRPVAELMRFVTDFFDPRVRYYVFSSDDPAPFLRDIKNVILRR